VNLIEGKDADRVTQIPTSLVVRDSA
jgi:hypothetical protein